MFIYVIHQLNTDYIKIGITDDVEKRLGSLQASNPDVIALRAVIEIADEATARRMEGLLKTFLADRKVHGEWFNYPIRTFLDFLDLSQVMGNYLQGYTKVNRPGVRPKAQSHGGQSPTGRARPTEAEWKVIRFLQASPDAMSWSREELGAAAGVAKSTASYGARWVQARPELVNGNGHSDGAASEDDE